MTVVVVKAERLDRNGAFGQAECRLNQLEIR